MDGLNGAEPRTQEMLDTQQGDNVPFTRLLDMSLSCIVQYSMVMKCDE